MAINWFPGHMTKSMRMIEDNLKLIDCIIYVLDSRSPQSCINPSFNKMIKNMPIIYVLNKVDLGYRPYINLWIDYLSGENTTAIAVNSTASKNAKIISDLIKKMCGDKVRRYAAKGVSISLKAMVLGVPNCGKSTLINNLCGSGKTLTGNKPGVTRGKQWVRVSENFEVLDTPGTLYPKLDNQKIAQRLAYMGSIKDEVVDVNELALSLMEDLMEFDPRVVLNRYNVTFETDARTTLEKIAVARGYLMHGKILDMERAASALLDDFRKGRLGHLTLEKPPLKKSKQVDINAKSDVNSKSEYATKQANSQAFEHKRSVEDADNSNLEDADTTTFEVADTTNSEVENSICAAKNVPTSENYED